MLVASHFMLHFLSLVCIKVIESIWISALQVKTVFLPTEKSMTYEVCAPLIATLPLEVGL